MMVEIPDSGVPKKIIASIQNHWVVLLGHACILITGLVLSVIFIWVAFTIRGASETLGATLIVLSVLTMLTTLHVFFMYVLEWSLSCLFITPQWLIDLHSLSFEEDSVSLVEISKINKIDKEKHGMLKNILNYGELVLSVTGVQKNPRYTYISRPSDVATLLESLKTTETPTHD